MSTELFNLNNDDYVWLHILNGEKNVHTLTRARLNNWAEHMILYLRIIKIKNKL